MKVAWLTRGVFIGFSGWAATPRSVSPDVVSKIKRVAVVSVTANQFTRQHVGFTVFGNQKEERSIDAWAADKAFEDQLGEAAHQVLGATVVKAGYSSGDFQPLNDFDGLWKAWGLDWSKIEPATRAVCSQNSLDALLVVAKQRSQDFFAHTNQSIVGAGIYVRRNISVIHLLSVMALLDCTTGKPLVARPLAGLTPQSEDDREYSSPVIAISDELASTPISQWTPEMESEIRESLINLPKRSWEKTLRSMISDR